MKNEAASQGESSEPAESTSAAESTDTQDNTETTSSKPEERNNVTTEKRKPLEVPSSVHVRITPDNLKDYVGPPVYQKDRMYLHPPPPGVSTGLGYLGNGSGAVMPVEASVSQSTVASRTAFLNCRIPGVSLFFPSCSFTPRT